MAQKDDGLLFADSLMEDLEVKVPECHPGGHGNSLPVEVVLEQRECAHVAPKCDSGGDAGSTRFRR